jgi:hypothetical protein
MTVRVDGGRNMSRSLTGLTILLVALVMLPLAPAFAQGGVAAGAAPGPATLFTGSCKKAATIDFAAADDTGYSTTSTSFVDVPGMSVTFNLGGVATSCVKVEYSATVFAATAGTARMFVQAVRDGVPCVPADVPFAGDDDTDGDGRWPNARAFNFVCTGVTPGIHTIKIQWRSQDGGSISTDKRSMFVHHK